MPEPEEVRFACIGCGAMNPAGAEVCAGCGHRFAGPAGGPVAHPKPLPIGDIPPMSFRDDDPSPSRKDGPNFTLLGFLGKVAWVILTLVATLIAFVVAFFVTCSATFNVQGNGGMDLPFLVGLSAAGLVVAVSVWVASTSRGR